VLTYIRISPLVFLPNKLVIKNLYACYRRSRIPEKFTGFLQRLFTFYYDIREQEGTGLEGNRPADQCSTRESWWQALDAVKPYALAFLVLTGLLCELIIHYYLKISVVYTQFYYLVIVFAGFWYGRKAVWVALFLGGFQIAVSWIITGLILPESLIRTLLLVIVAFVVGSFIELMNCYRDLLEQQNRDLVAINRQLGRSEEAAGIANKKLSLLASITRHDIRNQLMALSAFLELTNTKVTDTEALSLLAKAESAAENIQRQIEFTKNYEEIGVNAPQWQNVGTILEGLRPLLPAGQVDLTIRLDGLEVYADPLLVKVFENLIDNSLRHGERVRHITVSALQYGIGEIAIEYADDGVGVHEEDKERIFEKGFGKNTGLGLYLIREILAITGLTMKESGVYEKGVLFEIFIPREKFRFSGKDT
jgi:signal transduction histidine kinase